MAALMNIDTRIVLVNTSLPANIGSTARAMMTMGLHDLVLVAPQQFPHFEASALAAGAGTLLASARVVETLEEALAGCHWVFGTSARHRTIDLPPVDARAAGTLSAQAAAAGQKVAIVFGREDSGLTNAELQLCHQHVFIPSNPSYGVLNVAAAVQVIAYEQRMAFMAASPLTPSEAAAMPLPYVAWDEPLVAQEDMAQFYAHWERTLIAVGFLDPENPRQIMTRLRRLFGRTRLDRPEYNLLRGFCKRVLELSAAMPAKPE